MRVSLRLAAPRVLPLQALPDARPDTFRRAAFEKGAPCTFPKSTFAYLPAIRDWFTLNEAAPSGARGSLRGLQQLNASFFAPFADHSVVVEHSTPDGTEFHRAEAPLGLFVAWTLHHQQHQAQSVAAEAEAVARTATTASSSGPRLTVAQSPLASLPDALQAGLPVPECVLRAGRGDVYGASSLWMGVAPTITPLHRDPNPNLLVQLAGRKVIRMLPPKPGRQLWEACLQRAGAQAAEGRDDMMRGRQMQELELGVWGDHSGLGANPKDKVETTPCDSVWTELAELEALEAYLDPGDAVFIPTGWWHAVRGVGEGVTGSVNWWFR